MCTVEWGVGLGPELDSNQVASWIYSDCYWISFEFELYCLDKYFIPIVEIWNSIWCCFSWLCFLYGWIDGCGGKDEFRRCYDRCCCYCQLQQSTSSLSAIIDNETCTSFCVTLSLPRVIFLHLY